MGAAVRLFQDDPASSHAMNSHATQVTRRLRSQAGAALVEFALVAPIFLLLLLGMFDFGKVFNYWIDTTQLSHEGVRFAAVDKNPGPGATLADSIRMRADTDELKNGSASVSAPMKVCIDFPDGDSDVGSAVRVRIEFTYQFMGYLADSGLTTKTLTQEATMRIERPMNDVAAGCTA